jgi:hypothetical protein
MRSISSLFVLLILSAWVLAQDPPRVVAAIGGSMSVKNSPFSAEAVSESVQTLFDGNKITRSSTTKLYRNSEGRVRREMDRSSGGFATFPSFEPLISIVDPLGAKMLLDTEARIATTIAPLPLGQVNIVSAGQLSEEQRLKINKLKEELKLKTGQPLTDEQKKLLEKYHVEVRALAPTAVVAGQLAETVAPATATAIVSGVGNGGTWSTMAPGPMATGTTFTFNDSKYDTRTEELGSRDFDGVQAEGTRRVTIIPAGAIGNERPIETVYERWYSKDLQIVVMSKHSDPRFGEQTYRLTNIVRAEPDPSLFNVPTGYKVVSGIDAGGYYRAMPPKPAKVTTVATKQP